MSQDPFIIAKQLINEFPVQAPWQDSVETHSSYLKVKPTLLPHPIEENVAPLAMVIASAAMSRALDNKIFVRVETNEDGSTDYCTTHAFDGDIRQRALLEMKNVKQELADMMVKQGEGDDRHYQFLTMPRHLVYRYLPMALSIFFRDGNPDINFVHEIAGQQIPSPVEAFNAGDSEMLERIRQGEEQDSIQRWYVLREPEKVAWVERQLGRPR